MPRVIIKATKSAPIMFAMGLIIVAAMGMVSVPFFTEAQQGGAIWTTNETCANPAAQDDNEYAIGETVHVRGSNFDANTTYYFQITGQPGNASADPSIVVASGPTTTDSEGYFCVAAYVVAGDDDGTYTVDVYENDSYTGNKKNDNYHVNGVVCGNNDVEANEQCDDGNTASGDGCSALCQTEYCGDGITNNTDEVCDDGQSNGSVCSPAYGNQCTYCSSECEEVTLTGDFCGDNQVNGDEECDGSNGVGQNQSCSDSCTLIDLPYCGDGETNQTSEQCDNGQSNGLTCSPTYGNQCSYCSSTCQDVTLTGDFCGDNQVNGDEECDGSNGVGQNQSCSDSCTLIDLPYCGDEVVNQTSEQCDWDSPQACTTQSGYVGTQTCNMNPEVDAQMCTWLSCVPTEFCGDAIQNGPEQCDGTDGVGANQSCTEQCTLISVPFCGDQIKNGEEQCDGTDGVGLNQTCTQRCTLITNETPDPVLTLTKTDSPDPVVPGANITYTMAWTVTVADATNVVLTDVIPANTTFVSASAPGVYDAVSNTVTWNIGAAAIGNYSATLVVKVNSPLTNGTKINNTATIDSAETTPIAAVAQTTVTSGPVLVVEKTVDTATVNPGQTVNYTVKVTNTGNDTAVNVVMTDTLPSGFLTPDGLATVTHSFGNIAAGASATTTFPVVVPTTAAAGEVTNIVRINADNYTEISAQVALNVIVPVVLGEQIEETPVPQVLGESTELPVTGSNGLTWMLAGMLVATLVGLAVYLKPVEVEIGKSKSVK